MPATIRHLILDRDGTLNAEAPGGYVLSPDQWQWLPGVLPALSRLTAAGLRLSVATNQSCVGRGIIDAAALERVHQHMRAEVDAGGASLAAVFACPHEPGAGCSCRKPLPGLIEQAVTASDIAPADTCMVGDSAGDLQAAQAAGIEAWLVRSGKGQATERELEGGRLPDLDATAIRVFDDVAAVADAILRPAP